MTGEFFVTFLPADHAWISVHDFADVDGRPLDDHEDIRRLLERGAVAGIARRLIDENARFNIGSVTRNFNEPTLGLLVLESKRRSQFKFTRRHVERDGDATMVTLAFKETHSPTLVRGLDGRDLYSSGEILLEAGSGRVRRTDIRFTYGPVTARLTTTYAREPKLGLWVPTQFSEQDQRAGRLREVIRCEATYTNYRRFEVAARIR